MAHEQGNWDQVAADFEVHDEKLVRKWNEQIDSLLVFVCFFVLFSAGETTEPPHRLVFSQRSSPPSMSNPTRICNSMLQKLLKFFSSRYRSSYPIFLARSSLPMRATRL